MVRALVSGSSGPPGSLCSVLGQDTSPSQHLSTATSALKSDFFTITAEIGLSSLSICGQTREFIIYATRQRARVGNLAICCRKKKKQIDVSFYASVSPVIDDDFLHNIVKVVCGSTRLSPRESTAATVTIS